jgi:cytochrome c6
MKTPTAVLLLAAAIAAPSLVRADDAAALWASKCAMCHGQNGTPTMMGKKNGAADYTSAADQAKFTDAEAIAAITAGKGKMKSFGDKLTPDQVKALVAYVRSLKK